MGLIKIEPFLFTQPKMQLHFHLYIVLQGHLLM
jgi:hypothetical protein